MGGRYFYIKDGDDVWLLLWMLIRKDFEFYECRYGFGYIIIIGRRNGIEVE